MFNVHVKEAFLRMMFELKQLYNKAEDCNFKHLEFSNLQELYFKYSWCYSKNILTPV